MVNHRTVAEIQRKAVKRGKRSAVSRLLHAKYDKDVIAAWKLDLNRILHVFNVCSIVSLRLLLTVRVQTELAINTHGVVSDVHRGVVNTHAMVSELRRDLLESQERIDDQHQLVSNIHTLVHHQMTNCHHCPD